MARLVRLARFFRARSTPLVFAVGASIVLAGAFIPMRAFQVQSSTSSNDATLREQGRQVFTAHCGKCHDADAAKKLPDGTNLLARLAAQKSPETRLATRLKSMSEQDARGVTLYMDDLIAKFRATKQFSSQQ